jgi:hypothetical protein
MNRSGDDEEEGIAAETKEELLFPLSWPRDDASSHLLSVRNDLLRGEGCALQINEKHINSAAT